MSESIVLDTPEQINVWVLLSRRHQLQLQLNGIKTPGLIKWCRTNIPGCEHARTAKDCVVPVEYALSEADARVDYKLVNLHAMRKASSDSEFYVDAGIYDSPADITDPSFPSNYAAGLVELVLTLEPVRNPNGQVYTQA
jgi:hypothetical protein